MAFRYLRENVPSRKRSMATETQDPRSSTQLQSGIQPNAQVFRVRRVGQITSGDAMGAAKRFRAQPRIRRGRSDTGRSEAHPSHRRMVSAVPHSEFGLGFQRFSVTLCHQVSFINENCGIDIKHNVTVLSNTFVLTL